MKKITIILAIIITILCLNKEEKITIPKEAIRFRVIANSDQEKDQVIKKQIVSNLKENIKQLEFSANNLKTSRDEIKKEIPKFDQIVKETLEKEKQEPIYTINYGMNYFPRKEYKGVVYQEGDYESLVITLGNGLGENFWCVLFPPLCSLEQEETKEPVEYTSLIKEIIDKYF